jgi:hypothetical protein
MRVRGLRHDDLHLMPRNEIARETKSSIAKRGTEAGTDDRKRDRFKQDDALPLGVGRIDFAQVREVLSRSDSNSVRP